MDEPEGNGGGEDFTGGTGGGGHGGSGHVLRGQQAGIGAGQLYFLVVTACVIAAIAAIWLLCYGVKWCRKICKKRSQRRVGCFPTEETSGVALNQDWTHGDICIDMDMDTGEAEPKHSSNGRKADHTVISIFDDEDEIERLPELNGSIDEISRNSDARIQMEEEETQEKREEISTGTGQREDQEINQNENETHENETCQVEARTLDVAETKENLEENIQLVPALSCTILMPVIQEADEYESSSEEELKDLGNNRLPSPKYGSSNEGDMELPSSATCELRKRDQDTEDDSYGGESSEEELQPSNLPGTVDYYKTIQLQQTNPRSKIIDMTKQEMESGSGSESELEGQGNQGIKDYDSSNEGSPIMAVAIEEELESGTESKNELQTSGQLTSTSGIMQQKFEAEAFDAPGTIENLDERIQLGQAMSCIILMPAIHEAEEYDSSSEDELKELGKNRLLSPNYGSSNEGDTELPLSVTSDLEDQRESDQDTEDESCGSKSNSSVTVTSELESDELESEPESAQDTEDESYGSNNSIEEQLLNLPETVDYYEIIQLGPTTSTTIMDATEQETDCGSGSEFELGNQQITDYDSSNEGSSIMAVAMEEELESGTESQDECETSGQLGSTTGITQQSAEQAQPLSLGTLMNSEKKNYASSNSADDELEEEENGKMTDYESSDEASVTSSSSMTTEFGEAWEGDKEGHQLEAQASNVPEAVDNMQESTEPTRTDAGTSVMHDDDCDLGIESIFEEMESSQVIGDLLPKDMEPQKTVFTTSTGKGDQEQILKSTHFPFSVSNDNAGPFNVNQIEDVALVYTLNIDEEPPESPSAQLPPESDRPLEILDGTLEIPPSSIEGTCDNPRPKRQITPVHQVKSKWELADAVAADVPDTPSSAWQRDLKVDPDLLECAQAQCYAHQEESGGGLVIAGQLSAWWDSAARSLTPNSIDENESSYADTVAGNVLDKRSEEKTEIALQKDNDGSPSEGMNSDEENSKAFEKGQGLNDATSQSKAQVYENLADKSSE